MNPKRLHTVSLPKNRDTTGLLSLGTFHASLAQVEFAFGEPSSPAGIERRWIRDIDGTQVVITNTVVDDEWSVASTSEDALQLVTETLAERPI